MPQITESEYKAKSRAGRGGVYVFFGDEDYLIAHYRDKCRAPFIEDALEAFNYIKIPYFSAEDAELIVSSAMSPPMMSAVGYKLIEVAVENMDQLDADAKEALWEALSDAAEYEDNLVILPLMSGSFDYGTLPKRPSASYKRLLSANGVSAVYFPESTPAQLRRWIERHFEREGLIFDYDAADRMLYISGKKMTVLAEEIKKVIAYTKSHGAQKVTNADVDAVCCAVDKYDAFELSNAILDGRREDALSALRAERQRRVDPVLLLGSIMYVISNILSAKILLDRGASPSEISRKLVMHEYRAKLYINSASRRDLRSIEAAVTACAEADEKLKSTRLGYIALERLVCSIGSR